MIVPASPTRRVSPVAVVAAILLAGPAIGSAEILPARTWTAADGLLRDRAHCVVQDPRGFLWFCTSEGLARFDGHAFTNYTTADGLPHRRVNHLLITRAGAYWIASEGGLVRFDPEGQREAGSSLFVTYHADEEPPDRGSTSSWKTTPGRCGAARRGDCCEWSRPKATSG